MKNNIQIIQTSVLIAMLFVLSITCFYYLKSLRTVSDSTNNISNNQNIEDNAENTENKPSPIPLAPSMFFTDLGTVGSIGQMPNREIKSNWKNDNNLTIEIEVAINCAINEIKGSYEIEENLIKLKYAVKDVEVLAKCFGTHKLRYEFQNLPKKDYVFEVIDSGEYE